MGSKSSKEQGKSSEIEKLSPSQNVGGASEDVNLEFGIPEEKQMLLAKTVKSKEIVIEIPEKIELRQPSGTESVSDVISQTNINSDDDVIQSVPLESLLSSSSDFSSASSESLMTSSPKFDVMKYLESRGIDVDHPRMRELVESVDYQELCHLKRTMLTPKELFERDYGPILGGDSVKVIKAVKGETTKPLEPEVDAFGIPPGPDSSESLTDLSDDEDGWPKYDMNAMLEEAEKLEDVHQNPLIPTLKDYKKDKNTCGQRVLNHYDFVKVYDSLSLKSKHFECLGSDGTRTQDFWTQCHDDCISLISMFGDFYEEERGMNCARYIPEDNQDFFECGKISIYRLTAPEYPYEHCKIQKFAARCVLVPEHLGWYPIWHCQRAFQDDPNKDYTLENEEFEELKMKLLEEMPTHQWLQHGPMEFSALRDPMVERNSYLIHKEGSRVSDFLKQPIDMARMRLPFYQEYRDYVHPDDDLEPVITVSTASSSASSGNSS